MVTRGTVVEESLLAPRTHNFLAALSLDPSGGPLAGIAWVDISTGYVATKLSTRATLLGDLQLHPPAELVVPVEAALSDVQVGATDLPAAGGPLAASMTIRAALSCTKKGAGASILGRLLQIAHLATRPPGGPPPRLGASGSDWDAAATSGGQREIRFDDASEECTVAFLRADAFSANAPALQGRLTGESPAPHALESMALGGLLTYAQWTQRGAEQQLQHPVSLSPPHVEQPLELSDVPSLSPALSASSPHRPPAYMIIDPATRRALELTRPPNGRRRARGSLLHTLDLCRTAMGSRLLDRRLSMPLVDAELIERRLDAVGALAQAPFLGEAARLCLGRTPDLDRSLQRVCVGRFSHKDLFSLRAGLAEARRLGELLLKGDDANEAAVETNSPDAVEAAHAMHTFAVRNAVALMREGGEPYDDASSLEAVWDLARVDYDARSPFPPRKGVARKPGIDSSQVLAACAAVLLTPLRGRGEHSRVTASANKGQCLMDALAIAHASLVDGLVPNATSGGLSSASNEADDSKEGSTEEGMQEATSSIHPGSGAGPRNPDALQTSAAWSGDAWYIRQGFSAELDAARTLLTSATGLTLELQTQLQKITGVRSLRVRRGVDERLYVEAPARATSQLLPFLQAQDGKPPVLQLDRSLKSSSRYRCDAVQVRH